MKKIALFFTLLVLLFGGRVSMVSGRAPFDATFTITTAAAETHPVYAVDVDGDSDADVAPTTIVEGQQDDVASGFRMASAASPFTVTATHPTGNGLVIARGGVISATFSRAVNCSTVSTHTFTVRGKQTGTYTHAYNIGSNSVSFDAQPDYMPGEEIAVNLSSGLLAADGVPLTPYAWQFRTAVEGGTGVFTDSGQTLRSHSKAVALGDVDGDGDLDAFTANWETVNKLWLNDGAGTFSDSGQSLGISHSRDVALGDVDSVGVLDAFVANAEGQANKVWLNDGTGTFSDSGQSLTGSIGTYGGMALGDLDGDGDLDAFVAGDSGRGKVWLNDGTGTFSDSGQNIVTGSESMALGDLDGDGDLDAFVGNGQGQEDEVWLNDGAGTFGDSGQRLDNPYTSSGVALGDLDGDGDLDAFVAKYWGDPDKVWLNDGTGTFSDSGQRLGSAYSEAVALGDVDSDGDLDAIVASAGSRVWLNDGAGTFSESASLSLGYDASLGVALGDLDGDGDLDAFVANFITSRVWLNGVVGEMEVIYLPLALRHYAPPVTFPVHIGDAIPVRAVTHRGEVFYTTSVRMPDALPSGGRFYFSSQQGTVAEVLVDDDLGVLLDGREVFTYHFSSATTFPEPAVVEVPRTTMERLVGRTATVEYRDVYGAVVEASAIWLIWVP